MPHFPGIESEWEPHLKFARKAEVIRHYADDRVRLVVEGEGLLQD